MKATDHNVGPTTEAESLLEAFERCPGELDEMTARAAITLAKQMRLEIDELDGARKDDTAELRQRLADEERPYRQAGERLKQAREDLLLRLRAYLDEAGIECLKNELGLQVYMKRSTAFEVVDPAAVPLQFKRLVVDEDLVKAGLKDWGEIPGIRRVEKTTTIVV